jgi:hypothetical protein
MSLVHATSVTSPIYSSSCTVHGKVCSHLLTLVPRSRIFLPWRWRRYVPSKRRLAQDTHSATSQKTYFNRRTKKSTKHLSQASRTFDQTLNTIPIVLVLHKTLLQNSNTFQVQIFVLGFFEPPLSAPELTSNLLYTTWQNYKHTSSDQFTKKFRHTMWPNFKHVFLHQFQMNFPYTMWPNFKHVFLHQFPMNFPYTMWPNFKHSLLHQFSINLPLTVCPNFIHKLSHQLHALLHQFSINFPYPMWQNFKHTMLHQAHKIFLPQTKKKSQHADQTKHWT